MSRPQRDQLQISTAPRAVIAETEDRGRHPSFQPSFQPSFKSGLKLAHSIEGVRRTAVFAGMLNGAEHRVHVRRHRRPIHLRAGPLYRRSAPDAPRFAFGFDRTNAGRDLPAGRRREVQPSACPSGDYRRSATWRQVISVSFTGPDCSLNEVTSNLVYVRAGGSVPALVAADQKLEPALRQRTPFHAWQTIDSAMNSLES